MTKQDRTTLKAFFRHGALPSEEEYSDLIESTVNIKDDGFAKTSEDGIQLASSGGSLRILSIYEGLGTAKPSWVFDHGDKSDESLHIRPDIGKAALTKSGVEKTEMAKTVSPKKPELYAPNLTLTKKGCVGVNQDDPKWRLDVGGVARMQGRIGVTSYDIPYVKADGGWHAITQPMTGCHILEVTAGAGGHPGDGRYSLMHAIAMNAYQPRNPILNWWFRRRSIKIQTAMYDSYADRLRLRWVYGPDQHSYILEVCTNANFNRLLPDRSGRTDTQFIRYSITQLWFDEQMAGSTIMNDQFSNDRDKGVL
ncbi:MAG: hypothetical protein OSA51_05000 [Octadecabacter sp.]|nr:hypothetical protein [Octadecabacter sp.]